MVAKVLPDRSVKRVAAGMFYMNRALWSLWKDDSRESQSYWYILVITIQTKVSVLLSFTAGNRCVEEGK